MRWSRICLRRSSSRWRVCLFTMSISTSDRTYRRPVRKEQVVRMANSKRNMTIMFGRACWITVLTVYEKSQVS